jgi:hypothetical protein
MGMKFMAKSTNVRYRTLSKALTIIDPQGALMPGTKEHNRVTEMILSWMAEMEPDEVLRMSHDKQGILYIEGHPWLRNWKEKSKTTRSPKP